MSKLWRKWVLLRRRKSVQIDTPLAVESVKVDLTPDSTNVVNDEAKKCPVDREAALVAASLTGSAAQCPYHHGSTAPAASEVASPSAAPSGAPASASGATLVVASAADWPRATSDVKRKTLALKRDQADVDALLEKHSAAVANLKAKIMADDLSAARFTAGTNARIPYDDLWLLRFILSNGDGKDAEKAARATLEYREKHTDLLTRCANGEEHPMMGKMSKLSISEIWQSSTRIDEPVQLIRAGKSNVKKLMDTYHPDQVVEYMNYQKEQAFILCDDATRRTRRLVKMVTVVDMHSSRFADNDNRFFKTLGRASKDSELYYPQLLAITVGINVPSYLNLIWPIAKRLMPAKTLAKFRICGARDTVTQSAAGCPFATEVFTPETLVDFLGGAVPAPTTSILGPVDRPRVPYDTI